MDSQEKRQAIATATVVLAFLVLIALVATIGGGIRSYGRSEVRIADTDVSAESLDFAGALLNVTVYLDNSGNANSGEIDLMVKAYDADTNLLVTTNSTKVGEIRGIAAKSASTYLKLPKEGSYRLQIVVFEDGRDILQTRTTIYGLSSLEPPSVAKIAIRELDFLVESVEVTPKSNGEYAIINTTIYVDNLGTDVSGLRAWIKARDSDTQLIIDRKWIDLGLLKEGTTSLHYVKLRVLNGRDYIFEIQIWQSGRIIKEGTGMVLLSQFANKTMVLKKEEKMVEISPKTRITEFITPPPGEGQETPGPEAVPKAASGFGVLPAVFALVSVFVLLLKRRIGGA